MNIAAFKMLLKSWKLKDKKERELLHLSYSILCVTKHAPFWTVTSQSMWKRDTIQHFDFSIQEHFRVF